MKDNGKKQKKSRRLTFDKIVETPSYLRIFSVLVAILCWLVVALTISPTVRMDRRDVPVLTESLTQTLAALGLNVIEMSTETVTATVEGSRAVVPSLDPEKLAATVRLTNVTERGTYDLELVALNSPDGDYNILSYTPSRVQVRFDRLVTQTFEVEPMVNGISTHEDYTFDREYVTPERISVTGPQVELDRIARCVVRVDLGEPLDRTYAESLPIILEDAQGEEIDPAERHLTVDAEEAQLVVRVLKNKDLSLEIEFINEPRDFNVELLEYSMSNAGVLVAGPVDIIERYRQIIVGVIDLKELRPSRSSFVFDVNMPSDFVNLDNINSVEVNFDARNWGEETFSVDADKVIIVNAPTGYEASVLSDIPLSSVIFAGEKEILEVMTADDIIAEVDLSGKTYQTGQHTAAVRISAPTRGMVWPVGDYTVVIRIEEKEEE